MPRQNPDWKSRYLRIYPIIRALGLDPDEELERLAAIADLPATEGVAHPQNAAVDPRVTSDDEESSDSLPIEIDEEEQEIADGDGVGAIQTSSDPDCVDPDDCPCDGCGLRRCKTRRRP